MSRTAYLALRGALRRLRQSLIPYGRRVLRFLALPHYYVLGIAWWDCSRNRFQVAFDLLYIFFRLKTYPDHYSDCRLWDVPRARWHLYYGRLWEPYQKRQLTKAIQPPDYAVTLADKEVAHHLCVGLGLPVPPLWGCVNPGEDARVAVARALSRSPQRRIVLKPVNGSGGRSVQLITEHEGAPVLWREGAPRPLSELVIRDRSLLQEAVIQHPAMAAVYPGAVNTVRLQTLLMDGGEVLLLGAFVRFGRNHAVMDNQKSGGIGVGVDLATGRLHALGLDLKNRRYERHPESGVLFEGFQLPDWEAAVALARHGQQLISWYRLVGFDVAFTEAGPLIIEINPNPESVAIEACSGPLLEAPANALAFLRHDLLVNGPSKAYALSLLRDSTRRVDEDPVRA